VNLIVENVYPPIPDRSFDWCAYDLDSPEGPQGYGPTKERAIEDFNEKLEAA
jgi:hypothetical protein